MFEALLGWAQKYRASGKLERMWNFAGLQGGGGILNVDSHEELEAIMNEFPLGPFMEIEITPLSDLDKALQGIIEAAKAMQG